MITAKMKRQLMANWGDKAEAMEVYAEVKLVDDCSDFCVWLLALNPEAMDEVLVLSNGYIEGVHCTSLQGLLEAYNQNGESLSVDMEYRRKMASEIYKNIKVRNVER